MLDRLMRRTILTQSYAVMGHGINDGDFHQGSQSYGWSRVIRKYKKGSCIRSQTTVQQNTAGSCTHAQFPDTPCYVSSFRYVFLKIRLLFHQGFGGRFQIGASPYEPG